jgi:hypothetical protein
MGWSALHCNYVDQYAHYWGAFVTTTMKARFDQNYEIQSGNEHMRVFIFQ